MDWFSKFLGFRAAFSDANPVTTYQDAVNTFKNQTIVAVFETAERGCYVDLLRDNLRAQSQNEIFSTRDKLLMEWALAQMQESNDLASCIKLRIDSCDLVCH
jgi:hypothetical protein